MRSQTLREALWILAVLVVFTLVGGYFFPWLALLGVLLILYVFYFFRDPDRQTPADPRAVVAAADGVVVEIKEMVEPEVLKTTMRRVAIFLSVFDVHTNRAPIDGTVTYCKRYVGKFLDARHPDATHLNEYQTWAFKNTHATLVVRQITGAIARRIIGWSKIGDTVAKGERFGMIRFGSRTEVYLPLTSTITVEIGDRVKGGETVIATLS
jgi:phosphatidylserine decarboxylase